MELIHTLYIDGEEIVQYVMGQGWKRTRGELIKGRMKIKAHGWFRDSWENAENGTIKYQDNSLFYVDGNGHTRKIVETINKIEQKNGDMNIEQRANKRMNDCEDRVLNNLRKER